MIKFTPPVTKEFLSPPGDSIKEILHQKKWTQKDLARRIDSSEKHISELISAQCALSEDMADKLSTVLGGSQSFWINRERNYRDRLRALEESNIEAESYEWAKSLPLREMQKSGFFPKGRLTRAFIIKNIKKAFSFWGISSIKSWNEIYNREGVLYRASTTREIDQISLKTWLRVGEKYIEESADKNIPYFNKEKLKSKIQEMRSLTTSDPEVFGPRLQEILNSCGVYICLVDAFPKTHVSGATRKINSRPFIQLSLYGKKNDLFWFTLFHEIAHILLHLEDENTIFLEKTSGDSSNDRQEKEANDWAREVLIPGIYSNELTTLRSRVDVIKFSEKIDIHPGIVVGRLHFEGIIPYKNLADLKSTFMIAK